MEILLSHPILAMVFLLGLLVFVHEFGHFLVGKFFGIGVETFSIGFGPKLLSFHHKNTEYRIGCLPLGGYVKFAGAIPIETVPDEFHGKEFYSVSRFAQSCTIFAGPFANFLLAIAVFAYLGAKGLEHPAPIIGQVRHDSPAEKAGLHSGDTVVRIDNTQILNWNDLQESISSAPEKTLNFEILRNAKTLHIQVIPESVLSENKLGRKEKHGRIGIGYGFLPPIVDLLPGSSLARREGVRAGWHIKSVSLEGVQENILIPTWNQFTETLALAREKQVKSIRIEFEDPISKKIEFKIFSTELWNHLGQETLDLAKYFGLTDTQLTFSEVEESVKNILNPGDRLLAFDGIALADIYSVSDWIQNNEKENVTLKIQRNEEILTVDVKLKPVEIQKPEGKAILYILPVSFLGTLIPPPPVIEIYKDPMSDLQYALRTTAKESLMLLRVLGGLFTGDVPLKSLGGPILIAKVAGESAKLGLQSFLMSLALISINLGIVNLFPIPALDGGKLFMIFTEGILRRRLGPAFNENFQKIGFVMLMGLVVLATYNDLSRFWSSILRDFVGFFK